MQARNSPWIVRTAPRDGAALRLFLLPHAGASAVIYRDWHRAFGDGIDVCAIEPPGAFARRREPKIREVREFASRMAEAIEPYLDIPFAFFGYSLGALMAFECARLLCRTEKPRPRHLIVAAHKAPHVPMRNPPISRASTSVFVRELERRYGEFEAAIKAEPELMEVVVEMMRVDLAMLENYRFRDEAKFSFPVTAIGGTHDTTTDRAALEAWRAHTDGAFQTHMLPGGHFFLRTQAAELRAIVSDALGVAKPSGASAQV